jgi:hypothetical protein
MPTLLDNVLETHDGPEPRVLTMDVQAVLRRVVRPTDEEGNGAAVGLIAERANVSTRTVYRCLNPEESKYSISLDLADRLCLAAGTHIAGACRLVWPSGKITAYPDLDVALPDNLA